jgi:hypothetical protein
VVALMDGWWMPFLSNTIFTIHDKPEIITPQKSYISSSLKLNKPLQK